jgi:hypothetical protein
MKIPSWLILAVALKQERSLKWRGRKTSTAFLRNLQFEVLDQSLNQGLLEFARDVKLIEEAHERTGRSIPDTW